MFTSLPLVCPRLDESGQIVCPDAFSLLRACSAAIYYQNAVRHYLLNTQRHAHADEALHISEVCISTISKTF